MIIAGGTEIMVGVNSKTWGRFFLMILAGLLYIVGGAFALAQPIKAAIVLTLMLGAAHARRRAMVRIYIGTHMHSHARTLVIVGGVVTTLVGLLIIFGWPNEFSYVDPRHASRNRPALHGRDVGRLWIEVERAMRDMRRLGLRGRFGI